MAFDDPTFARDTDYVQWADSLMFDDAFEVSSPDNGAGAWSYEHIESQCIVGFWQGTLEGFNLTEGDRPLSEDLVAWGVDIPLADIASSLEDDLVPVETLAGDPVQSRGITQVSESGFSRTIAARAFSATTGGVIAYVNCPAGFDSEEMWNQFSTDVGAFQLVSMPR